MVQNAKTNEVIHLMVNHSPTHHKSYRPTQKRRHTSRKSHIQLYKDLKHQNSMERVIEYNYNQWQRKGKAQHQRSLEEMISRVIITRKMNFREAVVSTERPTHRDHKKTKSQPTTIVNTTQDNVEVKLSTKVEGGPIVTHYPISETKSHNP